MGRLAIFIDGGYVDRIAMDSFNVRPDFQQFSKTITSIVDNNVGEPVDLLRTFYYHCLPYKNDPPSEEEERRYSQARRFYGALERIPRFEVRRGRLFIGATMQTVGRFSSKSALI